VGYINKPLSKLDIGDLNRKYGAYFKITVNIETGELVAGCELHVDGEDVLLQKGGLGSDIWGGGIDVVNKSIDSIAVLNLRPSLGNDSMEILDSLRRKKFYNVVERVFSELWK